jgi:hypothetical protein
MSIGAAAQAGWVKAGANPEDYDMGVDPGVAFTGTSSGFIKSKASEPQTFGTYMQMFDASEYRGKRLRLSAYVKSEAVSNWAGVWMRVDRTRTVAAFDNMANRPITGTQPWTQHTIVLDVHPEATAIAFGILLAGKGAAWIDDVAFDVVDENVPSTDITTTRQEGPRNLDFELRPGQG